MKKFLFTVGLPFLFIAAFSQENQIKLIIRGDDMGYSHSGNEALIKCYKEGIEKSIEIIVPSPWFPEAVKLLKENPAAVKAFLVAFAKGMKDVMANPAAAINDVKARDGIINTELETRRLKLAIEPSSTAPTPAPKALAKWCRAVCR